MPEQCPHEPLLKGQGGSVVGDWVPQVVLTLCDWCPGCAGGEDAGRRSPMTGDSSGPADGTSVIRALTAPKPDSIPPFGFV